MRVPSVVLLTGLFALLRCQSVFGSDVSSNPHEEEDAVHGVKVESFPVDPDTKTATKEGGAPSCSADDADNVNDSDNCPSKAKADEDGEDASPKSLADFMRVFKSLGTSWSHVFGAYVDTVRSAHGKSLAGDLYADDMGTALKQLRELVDQAKKGGAGNEEAEGGMWDFRAVPLGEFDRTLDDVYVAFLRWSAVDSANEDDECGLKGGVNKKEVTPINVSNAFRRLEAYAAWMHGEAEDLLSPKLTSSSVKEARDLLYSRVAEDNCGRVVWWLDLGQTDFSAIKKLPQKDILRLFVWLAHLVMFSESAQENGILFVDSMGKVNFLQYMTMLPLQLGMVIDKFMICVIPLKTKLVVFMKRPLWFDVGFGLLSFFLKKKMKKRVELPQGDQASVAEIVGEDRVPVGFDDFEGTLTLDLIAEHEKRGPRQA